MRDTLSGKSGEGEYQAKRLVNEIEVEESPIVSLVSSELSEIALVGPSLTPRYLHSDHLGSTRLITDTLGNVLSSHDYYPFGGERLNSGPKDLTNAAMYAGTERDRETSLDYMQALGIAQDCKAGS